MHDWIQTIVEGGGYWGILALMALENVIPPIPSELIMGLAGIAVAHGRMEVMPLMLAGTIGSTLGNYAWFLLGRALGYERLKPVVDRYGRWLTMDWHDVARLVVFFQKHGQWVVFAMRFSPVMRTLISLPAGLARMGHARFLAFTFVGAAIWNAVLVWAGFHLGRNFGELERWTGPAATALVVGIVIAYAWRVVRWRPKA